jgi:hypothetical protein
MDSTNYDVLLVEDDDCAFWAVLENKTEQPIDFFYFEEDAKEYKQFLNSGGAFDGFTPSFVLKEVVLPKDDYAINDEFSRL